MLGQIGKNVNLQLLDNFKIRNKLIMIYVFCVVIPVLLSNYAMYSFIRETAIKEQRSMLENMLERLEYNFTEKINSCVSISNYLYTDRALNQFIKNTYATPIEYYHEYNKLMQDNVIRYYYTAQSVYNIEIYTDNPGMINGGNFFQVKDVVNEQWYKDFLESGKDIFVYSYYNEGKRHLSFLGPARTISIIRTLDNINKGGHKRLLKIDMDYNGFLNDVLNEKENKTIYICDDRHVLLSSEDVEAGQMDFLDKSEIALKEVTIEKQYNAISDQWTIYVTTNKSNLMNQLADKQMMWFIIVICNFILPTFIIIIINRSFSHRIDLTEEHLRKVEKGEFERINCYEGKDEIGNLIRSYNLMVVKIKELIEVVFKRNSEKQALEISKKHAELNALQSQVNPHFLFNTLESIRMRCLIKHEMETSDIIGELAMLMRRTIEWGKDFVAIDEEMRFVESYLSIQKYRFGERLAFSFYVKEECKAIRIPKFSIITFVENACIHGIERKTENGSITVVITDDEKKLLIEIMDNGSGMSGEQLEEIRKKFRNASVDMLNEAGGIGMLNAYIRLKMYYLDEVLCEIESEEGKGTYIFLEIPIRYNENLLE
ncbi:sensor histidine kinase [Cellulosilyticum sp. I15G10I2]|uniref:sensor histidine kinase n=1 Tax=Cellulosilyticum sp. I15G10I2 TaxID=1892843 RepID=UPI00085C3743|nr:histidine kinase [Cellulosilyticum sp. I15G10I2]